MWKSRKHTLIVVIRMMTEAKIALAGRTAEVFARFKASMAAFKSTSRSSGRWESAFMVEGDSCEITVRCEDCEDDSEPYERQFFHGASCKWAHLVGREL